MQVSHIPLAYARRAGAIESVHYGAVAVVDAQGSLVYSAGDPEQVVFGRSALKPFQALPFFAEQGPVRLGLSQPEAALLCASHSGEARHAMAAESILSKAGSDRLQLRCGCHVPFHFSWFDKQPQAQDHWNELHHNCSGKHAGFIAAAKLQGLPAEGYLKAHHPVQIAAKQALADCAGIATDALVGGIDGCSAPTYGLPLRSLARAFAQLARPANLPAYALGLDAVAHAMVSEPEMVSGSGRNDAAFMQAGRGDWVCKIGAEAVQCIAIRSLGLGIAIKIADGNYRGLFPAAVAVLERLGVLDAAQTQALSAWRNPQLKNSMGLVVGDIFSPVLP